MSNLATIVNNILADSGIDDISVVIGSGTSGYIPVFTSTGRTIGNSILNQSGGNLLIGGNIALHAGNFNSYAPTLTGVGASGTWGISITGNADTVDGYHMNQNLLTSSSPTFAGLTSNGSIFVNGVGVFTSSSDHQISLRSPDAWTGIEFDDSQSGFDYIWFNGIYQTFAIGGGGASVLGKKLHIDGGTTIGSNYDSTSAPSNGLNVEGAIQQAGNQVLHAGNFNSYAPTLTGGGASGTWGISITGNANTATNLSNSWTNWNSVGGIGSVVGMLAWKNYGNNHVIFDASNSTSPSGSGVNSSNPDVTWSASYPTLMGWNGSSTYGVRVDSARYSDFVGGFSAATFYRSLGFGSGYPSWNLNTVDPDRSGFTYGNGGPYTGPFIHIGASGYGLQFNAPYGGDGYGLAFRTRNGDTGSWNSWRYPAVYGVNINGGGALYATIYYDQNDTGYYVDPASGSRMNSITYDNLYFSADSTYGFLGRNVYADTVNGRGSDPLELNYYDGGEVHIGSGGSKVLRSGTFYSPIFYDSQDTYYYLDPNSTSRVNVLGSFSLRNNYTVDVDHTYGIYFDSGGSNGYAIYRESGSWAFPYPDLRISFHTGIKLGANASYNGIRFYTDTDMGTQVMSVNNASDGVGGGNVYVNNTLVAGDSLRATIFYDSNNTGYYVDPSSTSNDALRIQGGALFGPNPTWGQYLAVGTNGRWSGSYASVATTDGNLHLDAKDGSNIYLAWYNGSDVIVGGGIQSTIYYDRNDTGFYVNPNSASRLNIIYPNTSYFGVDGNKGYGQGFGTYSSSLHKIAYMSFDWDSNYDTYSNHGIASTSRFGGFSDSMSINSYNDINLRIDTNDNDSSSYVRFHHHTTGENTFAYIGYNHCISEFQMFLAGMYCTSSYSGYCYNDGYYNGGYSSSAYMRSSDFCQIFNTGFCGLYVVNYGPSIDFGTYSLIQRPSTGECFYYDGGSGTLYIGGNICQNYYSDCKYKENITEIDSALDKIEAMRGVEFDWNELGEEEAFRKGHEVGVIAQEVQAVYPQAVREVYKEREDHVATALVVDYEKFTPLLIQSIKELKVKVDNIKSRLDAGGL